MIDVHIVDDHKMVVESLGRMIDASGTARVVGKYFDLETCRRELDTKAQGIMLLDVELPDGNGVDFCVEVKRNYPELKIVMLTSYKEFNIAKHALHNGALGYVLKNSDHEEIFAALEAVSQGRRFLCEQIDVLLRDRKDEKEVWLTNREKEVLRYTAAGMTARETADRINRDPETVRHHRKNLFLKLGARNMAELIKKGYEMALI
jgi:DNA-binding NarL/FixJ family response regulator